MKNKNVLNVCGLRNRGIGLKDIKNCLTTTVKHSCFGFVDFPFRKNYFVFIVYPDGSIKPRYRVCNNPYSAVLIARLYNKVYHYLSDCHIEIVRFDLQRFRHISHVSGHGEPVEDIFLPF